MDYCIIMLLPSILQPLEVRSSVKCGRRRRRGLRSLDPFKACCGRHAIALSSCNDTFEVYFSNLSKVSAIDSCCCVHRTFAGSDRSFLEPQIATPCFHVTKREKRSAMIVALVLCFLVQVPCSTRRGEASRHDAPSSSSTQHADSQADPPRMRSDHCFCTVWRERDRGVLLVPDGDRVCPRCALRRRRSHEPGQHILRRGSGFYHRQYQHTRHSTAREQANCAKQH